MIRRLSRHGHWGNTLALSIEYALPSQLLSFQAQEADMKAGHLSTGGSQNYIPCFEVTVEGKIPYFKATNQNTISRCGNLMKEHDNS